jgi:cation:H+ antiporter
VGITSVIRKDPEIFVGNLLGGVLIIFLFIIPVLAILGNGIKLQNQLEEGPLLFSLFVIAIPAIFVADKNVSTFDGIVMVALYFVLFFFLQKKQGVWEAVKKSVKAKAKINYSKRFFYIITGIILIFFSSNIIVNNTIHFSELFHVSPFLISLLFLALGTNLPELSLAIRAVIAGKKEVAFGDYIGSAAANTLLFGFLSLMYDGDVNINGSFYITFFFIAVGLGLFYYFSRSSNNISRKEGFILFSVYLVFLAMELLKNHLI